VGTQKPSPARKTVEAEPLHSRFTWKFTICHPRAIILHGPIHVVQHAVYLARRADNTRRCLWSLPKSGRARRHDGLAYWLMGPSSSSLRTMEHALRAPGIYAVIASSEGLRVRAGKSCRRRRPVYPVKIFVYENLIAPSRIVLARSTVI
jgi:hypothetical protein